MFAIMTCPTIPDIGSILRDRDLARMRGLLHITTGPARVRHIDMQVRHIHITTKRHISTHPQTFRARTNPFSKTDQSLITSTKSG